MTLDPVSRPTAARPPRLLVEALAAFAPRYSPDDTREKVRLLERLAGTRIAQPRSLTRLHETLCFLRAYPDDAEVLAAVRRALAAFPARVARLGRAARGRLADSGIAGTSLEYPFGFPMARWLVSRFPRDVEVAWRGFDGGDRLEETLALLVADQEDEAFSEGGVGWRRWLALAKGGRRVGDLQLLVELFRRARLPAGARDLVFDTLGLPIRWRLRGAAPSRTAAALAWARPFFHGAGLTRTGVDFVAEARRPLAPLRRADRPLAEALIEAARAALATRTRELFAFSYPNPEDVLIAEPGRGLRIALIGLAPEWRLPFQAYYAFFVLKNGVPISYGGAWGMFGRIELGLNIFESFRPGESVLVFAQILRAYRQVFRVHTVIVDRYQLGYENVEALRSGAFYFYDRLGFRPLDPEARRVAGAEHEKIARDRAYRTPLGVLARLARGDVALHLAPPPVRPLGAGAVATLVTERLAREFGGDRYHALREDTPRVARVLGAGRRGSWPPAERRAFERLVPVVALVPDLERWSVADRARLVEVIRAKGGPSERAYVRALDGHRRLRRTLEALVARRSFP